MYLITIKLAGFKSFVDPTTIQVHRSINAIVGPNGCGKSNIVDAIRWVVGEISAKQLRGQSMSDVIFGGTSGRKPVGQASVELIFDNSDGRLGGEYSAFAELSIRRQVSRDGASKYMINGTNCRRRDILDLFIGTGLGPRSYSVIEQGMISKLIEAKPDDMRAHIEVAAGTTKFKERKRETEIKIRHTRENLDRLSDLRDELEKQLRHLSRQATAAKKYKAFQEEKAELSAQVKAMQWRSMHELSQEKEAAITTLKVDREAVHESMRILERSVETLRTEQSDLNDLLQLKQKEFYDLNTQVSSLEQEIRAGEKTYSRSTDELTDNEVAQQEYDEQILEYEDAMLGLSAELETLLPSQSSVSARRTEARNDLERVKMLVAEHRRENEDLQSQLMHNRSQLGVCETKIEHGREKQLNQQRLLAEIVEQDLSAEISLAADSIPPLKEAVDVLKVQTDELESKRTMLSKKRQEEKNELHSKRGELKDKTQELRLCERDLTKLQARQEAELSADDASSKRFIEENNLLEHSSLVELLTVAPKWERAVETVLRSVLEAVCVENLGEVSDALSVSTAIQLMFIEPNRNTVCPPARLSNKRLLDEVSGASALTHWLSGVYIVDTLSQAHDLRGQLVDGESVITADGHWLSCNWWRVCQAQTDAPTLISREKDIAAAEKKVRAFQEALTVLETEVEALERDIESVERELDDCTQILTQKKQELYSEQQMLAQKERNLKSLESSKVELEQKEARLRSQDSQLVEELAELVSRLENVVAKQPQLEERQEVHLQRREQLNGELESAQTLSAETEQEASALEVKIDACQTQLSFLEQSHEKDKKRLVGLVDRQAELQELVDSLAMDLPEQKNSLQEALSQRECAQKEVREQEERRSSQHGATSDNESKRKGLQKYLDGMQETLVTLQMEREGAVVRKATLMEQLDESSVNLQNVLDNLPEELDLEKQEASLKKVSASIERLGAINLAAIDEHEEVNERKTYLDQQNEDLVESLSLLESAIEKIDRESRQKFKMTYDQVNKNFQEMFPSIFGGGSASLELTENDWLTAGVTLKAQPPGKRNTSIHLLSGGEKALTALALVFSLFKLNPSPFCILDEVDAPLDDLNVGRFGELIKRMSDTTQFLMISHNKLSIAIADKLLGITMQEPGVSRVVSVEMTEALEMMDA